MFIRHSVGERGSGLVSPTITRPSVTALAVFIALLLAGCAPQTDYDALQARYQQEQAANQKLHAANTQLQAKLAPQGTQTYTVAADLLFVPGNFDVTQNGQAALNDIAGKLSVLKSGKIKVSGYTDDQGIGESLKKQGIKTNLDLSTKRADVVANYLRTHGVEAKLISAKGYGDTHPVAPNNTAAGRAQNRRIEIVVEGASS